MRRELIKVGQVSKGDILHIMEGKLLKPYVAADVLNKGLDNEEVVLDKRHNTYFITSMVIDGSSWAKSVEIFSTPQST